MQIRTPQTICIQRTVLGGKYRCQYVRGCMAPPQASSSSCCVSCMASARRWSDPEFFESWCSKATPWTPFSDWLMVSNMFLLYVYTYIYTMVYIHICVLCLMMYYNTYLRGCLGWFKLTFFFWGWFHHQRGDDWAPSPGITRWRALQPFEVEGLFLGDREVLRGPDFWDFWVKHHQDLGGVETDRVTTATGSGTQPEWSGVCFWMFFLWFLSFFVLWVSQGGCAIELLTLLRLLSWYMRCCCLQIFLHPLPARANPTTSVSWPPGNPGSPWCPKASLKISRHSWGRFRCHGFHRDRRRVCKAHHRRYRMLRIIP